MVRAMLCYVLCYAMCYAMLCAILCYVLGFPYKWCLRYVMEADVKPALRRTITFHCYVPCYAMLCYAMCYAMLCAMFLLRTMSHVPKK